MTTPSLDRLSTWFVPWNPSSSEEETPPASKESSSASNTIATMDDAVEDSPWMTVYYFPHAGGSADTALAWWKQQPKGTYPYSIRVVALPGRGRRLGESAIDEFDALAEAIANAIENEGPTKCIMLWGHSFGALLASRVAVLLQQPPSVLLVSAHPYGNEGSHQTEFYTALDGRTDDAAVLLSAIEQFGLIGANDRDLVLSADDETRDFLLAPLQQDLAMAQQFQVVDNPTNVPVVVMGGTDDLWCSMEELETSWRNYSTIEPRRATMSFPGGHFYFMEHSDGAVQRSVHDLIQSVLEEEFHWDSAKPNPKLSILSGPRVKYPPEQYRPIHELIERQALETPDRIAIEDGAIQWTYQQARREAHALVRLLNIQPGDCVGVALPHCADYILLHWAIFLAGGAIVPVEVGRTGSSALPIVPPIPVACIVTDAHHAPRIRDANCRVIQLDRNRDGADRADDSSLIALVDLPTVSMDDLAYVTTTSGTTGKPKVVRNVHRGAATCFLAREHVLPYDDSDDWREGMNLFFVWECLRPLMFGRTAVVIPDATVFDPREFVAFLKKERIHRFMINPALMTNLLDQFAVGDLDGTEMYANDLGEVKHIFLEGEVVPSHLVRAWNKCFPRISVWNIYSTWESLDVSMANLTKMMGDSEYTGPAPVGEILPNVTAYIVDSLMRVVPRGVSGELAVVGPGVSLGYDDVDQTIRKFARNPFQFDLDKIEEKKEADWFDDQESFCASAMYKTGDRAVAEDTFTVIKGRIDSQMIKIRAFKVSPNWVEEAILRTASFSRVSAAIVVPQLDSITKQPTALAAYLVFGLLNDEEKESATRQIHECLIENLPEYAVPSFYIPLQSLPIKTGSGRKLDTTALPDPVKFAVDLRTQRLPMSGPNMDGSKGKAVELIVGAMRSVLENDVVDLEDNFFSNGGHSLRAASLVNLLSRNFGMKFTVIDVYNNPTARQLALLLKGSTKRPSRKRHESKSASHGPSKDPVEIAIVGMEGRFPGAMSVDELWHEVLLKGKTAVRELSKQELKDRGVPASVYDHPSWVAKAYAIDHADKFDASFWGISKEEATLMDPQHRVFLEVAWAAMENAGYAPRSGTPERTGVFAACGIDGYLHHHLKGGGLSDPLDPGSVFLTEVGNEKDYISSRVSFGLDLLGPSVTVTSACSSGLAAIIQGASSLASMETDMVVAGASSITFPNLGYLFDEGLVASRDGIVRPFDETANGTVFGDSVGCVVLKRLQDAERDEDNILAVMKGWGQSNDGRQKAGYFAPSAYGQSLAIEDALRMAKVDPDSISYVECHATATEIGDGVEIMGILEAYGRLGLSGSSRADGSKKITALGSVKGNIGHANAAAGLTGFIKTVLMLKEQTLVPTTNLQKVSSKISHPLVRSPFFVLEDKKPRLFSPLHPQERMRAGVSSFGIGGANAHCILEDYHPRQGQRPRSEEKLAWKFGDLNLLTLSAGSKVSLLATMSKFADFLAKPDAKAISPASFAYTTQVAREHFKFRYSCPFRTAHEACEELQKSLANEIGSHKIVASKSARTVAFVFPGQGSQYPNMGRDLFNKNPLFRSTMERCADIAKPLICFDLIKDYLYRDGDEIDTMRAAAAQMSLFAVEYSLGKLLLATGLQPVAVCGHSIGEIVAATISGVLSLEDAIKLIAIRSEACENSKVKGLMLAVTLPELQVRELLNENLWLALINGTSDCVVGGEPSAIEHFRQELIQKGVSTRLLNVSHPFHTPLMTQAGRVVAKALSRTTFESPKIPMTSNVTGRWLQDEMCDPEYWAAHLCSTVQWTNNMECLLAWEPDVVIEVGPGCTLGSLFERSFQDLEPSSVQWFRTMRSFKTVVDDNSFFVGLISNLWCEACSMDFASLYESRRRELLPTYAFEQTSFWKHPECSVYVEPSPCRDISPTYQTDICIQTSESMHQREFSCLVPISKPQVSPASPSYRMYCFAFAGGSWRAFTDWKTDGIALHVVAVDPQRMFEKSKFETDALPSLIADMIAVDTGPDDRLILCGLSFGALRAIEVFDKLPQWAKDKVDLFCVAGRSPPLKFNAENDAGIDIDKCALAPTEVRQSPEWKSFFLPRLIAELNEDRSAHKRIATLLSERSETLLACDLVVCCGIDDDLFLPADAHLWDHLTSCCTSVELFEGDHSFLQRQNRQIFERICKRLPSNNDFCSPTVVPYSYSVEWQRLRLDKKPTKESAFDFVFAVVSDAMPILSPTFETMLKSERETTFVLVIGRCNCDKQALITIEFLKQIAAADVSTEIIMIHEFSADGSLIGGLSKSIPFEFPNIRSRRISIQEDHHKQLFEKLECRPLSYSNEAPNWIKKVIDISNKTNEADLFLRVANGVRFSPYAPRLQSLKLESKLQGNETLGSRHPEQHFVITGGTGGIGSELVDWLVAKQDVSPDMIILLSRKTITSRRGEIVVQIDSVSLQDLLRCEKLVNISDVAGIFHLAGVVEDAIVPNISFESFQRIKQPKADFLSSLLRLIVELNWEPVFLCNFSSTTSVFGFPGQTSYCAASSYLDALAMDAVDSPCPVITINWGPWAEVGMSKVGSKGYQTAIESGDKPLLNGEAFLALSHIVKTLDSKQYVVCNVDWEKSIWRESKLLSCIHSLRPPLATEISQSTNSDKAGTSEAEAPSSSSSDEVIGFLRDRLSSWHMDETLVSLGVDSLDMVRLRNAFAKTFRCSPPLSLFMQHGITVRSLVDELRSVLSAS